MAETVVRDIPTPAYNTGLEVVPPTFLSTVPMWTARLCVYGYVAVPAPQMRQPCGSVGTSYYKSLFFLLSQIE